MGSRYNRCATMFFICSVSTSIAYGLIAYKLLKIPKKKNIKNRSTAITGSSKTVLETVSYLPLEIIYEILPYLSLKDLLKFKTVCKQWKTLIHEALTQDSNFPQKFKLCKSNTFTCHSFPYSLEERKKKNEWVLGTCNGLDLTMERKPFTLRIFDSWIFCVRNTETRQVLRVPCPEYYKTLCHFAFAFIPKTNEYKLANVYRITETKRQCAVLTLGGSGGDELMWRCIDFPDSKKEIVLVQDNWVVQAGAVIHCMNYITLQPGLDIAYEIMSFDLESEEITESYVRLDFFSNYPLPTEYAISWNGCLAFVRRGGLNRLDVWVLEDYKKNKWKDAFSVPLTILKELKSDYFDLLVAQDDVLWFFSVDAEKAIGYDIRKKRIVQTFHVPQEVCATSRVFYQVPSLASLNGMVAAHR